mmetsp:Transcript_78903/g.152367  ORF Transcript_78903/g.152367 Transcript_78903/m.152367 type:complete len:234 (-) Transcript_78903:665-1366(-)
MWIVCQHLSLLPPGIQFNLSSTERLCGHLRSLIGWLLVTKRERARLSLCDQSLQAFQPLLLLSKGVFVVRRLLRSLSRASDSCLNNFQTIQKFLQLCTKRRRGPVFRVLLLLHHCLTCGLADLGHGLNSLHHLGANSLQVLRRHIFKIVPGEGLRNLDKFLHLSFSLRHGLDNVCHLHLSPAGKGVDLQLHEFQSYCLNPSLQALQLLRRPEPEKAFRQLPRFHEFLQHHCLR